MSVESIHATIGWAYLAIWFLIAQTVIQHHRFAEKS